MKLVYEYGLIINHRRKLCSDLHNKQQQFMLRHEKISGSGDEPELLDKITKEIK